MFYYKQLKTFIFETDYFLKNVYFIEIKTNFGRIIILGSLNVRFDKFGIIRVSNYRHSEALSLTSRLIAKAFRTGLNKPVFQIIANFKCF